MANINILKKFLENLSVLRSVEVFEDITGPRIHIVNMMRDDDPVNCLDTGGCYKLQVQEGCKNLQNRELL